MVQTYTATSLSRNYFSETKDILYCDGEKSSRRCAVQYVLSQVSPRRICLTLDSIKLCQYVISVNTIIYGRSMASHTLFFEAGGRGV